MRKDSCKQHCFLKIVATYREAKQVETSLIRSYEGEAMSNALITSSFLETSFCLLATVRSLPLGW